MPLRHDGPLSASNTREFLFRLFFFLIGIQWLRESTHLCIFTAMCNLKTWYTDHNGCVAQCTECGYFRLSFGTTLLTLSSANFVHFSTMVARRIMSFSPLDEHAKYIVFPTPCGCTQLILTEGELYRLHGLLQCADIEIKVGNLLDLFHEE